MTIWKRVKDCALCGRPKCVVRIDREDMGYCFRYSTTFFVKKDGKVVTAKDANAKCCERGMPSGGGQSLQAMSPKSVKLRTYKSEPDWPAVKLKKEDFLWENFE